MHNSLLRCFLSAVAASALLPACADGGVIASDGFAYPDGTLYGANGGVGWTAIWTGNGVDVVAAEAVTNTFANPPKYGARPFNNPSTTGSLFVKFKFNATAFAPGDYIGCQLTSGVNNGHLSIVKQIGAMTFDVGNSGFSSTGIVIQPGVDYVLVGAYHVIPGPATDLLLLWVNPDASDYFDPITGANSADATRAEIVTGAAASVTLYSAVPGTEFDDLIIADTPADVGLATAPPACIGDANGDNIVNFDDINSILANWLNSYASPPGTGPGDANADGTVNFDDINTVLANWLAVCS